MTALNESIALTQMVLFSFLGFFIATNVDITSYQSANEYKYILYTLLSIGLYASVYGIDLNEVKNEKYLIINVVTIGVILKVLIIGSIFFLFTRDMTAFIYAVIVAQIDPLSVSALTNKNDGVLSSKAKNILLAWASFDDPITVILSIVIALYVFPSSDISNLSGTIIFISNFLLPLGVYGIYQKIKSNNSLKLVILLISFLISIYFGLMLAIALIALFLRPVFPFDIDHIVQTAYFSALIILGTYLINGLNFEMGIILAISAIIAQILVSAFFSRKLDRCDSIYLSFSQQNGITAVILALLFEPLLPGVVAIVALAIIVINIFHMTSYLLIRKIVCSKN